MISDRDGGWRSVFFIIFSAVVGTVASSLMAGNVISLFAIKLGADEFQLGLIAFLVMIPVLLRIFTMTVMEKRGKRWILQLGFHMATVFSVPILALPILLHFEIITHTAALYGLLLFLFLRAASEQFGATGWWPIIQDNVAEASIGRFFGQFRTYWQIAGLVSMLAAAWFVGKNPDFEHFTVIFAIAVVGFFLRAWVLKWIAQKPPQTRFDPSRQTILFRLREVFTTRTYRALMTYIVFYSTAASAAEMFKIKMLKDLQYGDNFILAATSMMALGAVLSLNFWGKLADKYGNRSVFSISHVGMIVTTLLWLLVEKSSFGSALIFMLFLISSIFNSGNGIVQTRYMMHAVPLDKQYHITIISMISSLTMAIAPLLGGVFLRQTGALHFHSGAVSLNNYHFLFLISAGLFFWSHILRGKLAMKKDTPTAQVISLLTQSLRGMFDPFVRLRRPGEPRSDSNESH